VLAGDCLQPTRVWYVCGAVKLLDDCFASICLAARILEQNLKA
jgi:hypothetical protein